MFTKTKYDSRRLYDPYQGSIPFPPNAPEGNVSFDRLLSIDGSEGQFICDVNCDGVLGMSAVFAVLIAVSGVDWR